MYHVRFFVCYFKGVLGFTTRIPEVVEQIQVGGCNDTCKKGNWIPKKKLLTLHLIFMNFFFFEF